MLPNFLRHLSMKSTGFLANSIYVPIIGQDKVALGGALEGLRLKIRFINHSPAMIVTTIPVRVRENSLISAICLSKSMANMKINNYVVINTNIGTTQVNQENCLATKNAANKLWGLFKLGSSQFSKEASPHKLVAVWAISFYLLHRKINNQCTR